MHNNCKDSCCKDHLYCCAYKFIKWGLGFFILGILVGFGVLIHYLIGSDWNNTSEFLTNMTLWFGSPLSLSSAYLQIGGLGMVACGVAKICAYKACCEKYCSTTANTNNSTTTTTYSTYNKCRGGISFALASIGLIALLIFGYIGYFIADWIWPGFYYTPINAGKNWWLVLQGLSILVYLIGIISCCCCLCKCKNCDKCSR